MLNTLNKYKSYLKELITLALPLFIGNLGHTLIGATDVLVVGHYNIDSLASISIANSIIFTVFIFGIGIICAVSIILSNMRGANKRIKKYLPSTLIFSFILSVIFTVICYACAYLIPYMGFEENLVPYIMEYTKIVAFSMFGIFFYEGIKQFLQAYEIVSFPNILAIIMVFVNLILDIVFVFGCGFIPSMGSKGAGIATLSVRTLMGIIMFLYIMRFINRKEKFDISYALHTIKIGTSIGIALTLEFLAFNIITVLIGRISGIYSAVHSILITISSATYMVPMAVSTALSVKVAYYFGADKPDEIKKYSYTALTFVLSFMCLIALTLAVFPEQILKIFTNEHRVIEIALPIISIVAVYQIFDGFQSIMGAILRGFKMTKASSFCVLTGYWLIGAPVAYFCVHNYNMELRGYWIALAVSLCTMGFFAGAIAKWKYKNIQTLVVQK